MVKMLNNIKTIGYVNSVKDGIIEIKGLKACQEELIFIYKDNTFTDLISIGIVMSILEDSIQVALIENVDKVNEGYLVVSSFDYLTISVGDWIIGTIIDPLGRPLELDEEKEIQEFYKFPIETKAPGIIERTSVHEPLITGIKAVDSLIPIGLGQRELIIGDRKTGKTSLAIDFILAQRERNMIATNEEEKVYSIYCAIGQKQNTILNIVKMLIKEQVLDDCVMIVSTSADSAMLNILAPYSAMAIAEYFRDTGRHSLIILDDLSKHANSYRQISLLLRRPPGREAYPGDIFYLHSRLLERSAKLSEVNGGGSITCIPIIETQDGDVSAYIPTNIISITDGQIYLDSELFHKGIRPAIHAGLSVSRVGSAAQMDTMKEVAASLKLSLAQYREVSVFTSLGADIDEYTKKLIERGNRIMFLLKQPVNQPYPLEDEILLFHAAANGFFDKISLNQIKAYEYRLIAYFEQSSIALPFTIDLDEDIDDDVINTLYYYFLNYAKNKWINFDFNYIYIFYVYGRNKLIDIFFV